METNFKTALAIGAGCFLVVFGELCKSFDPMTAFCLSVAALLTVKN
ncbi:MAG: hypothetical protein WCJ49_03350 [Deltaproteobacteria bacterium]